MSTFWASTQKMIVPVPYAVGGALLVVLSALAALSKWSATPAGPDTHTRDAIRRLVTQSAQWGSSASQDTSILLRVMHVNYALAYLRAAKVLASDADIAKAASVNVAELLRSLEEQQQAEIRSLAQECPTVRPDTEYAVSAGWVH